MHRRAFVLTLGLLAGPLAAAADELDTVTAAIGHTLIAVSAGGDTTTMHLRHDHTFRVTLDDPNQTAGWVMDGGRLCQRTDYGPRECHRPAGRWIVERGKLCMMPDGSAQNWRECFVLDRGKKLGDTWTQVTGNGDYTMMIRAGQ